MTTLRSADVPRWRTAICAAAIIAMSAAAVSAQTTKSGDTDAQTFVEDARLYAIETVPDRAKLSLREASLLNWTNPVRQQERGAMYVWLRGARPAVIGSLFTYQYNDQVYTKHEFHTLSPKPLHATFDGKLAWTPDRQGIVWADLPEAPAPANAHVGRSLQMRQIARGFRTELIDPKGERNELRLAPRPLFEYAAPEEGVLDGAILSFVVATDPEVLLLLEAFDENRNGKPVSGYRYAIARFHYWHLKAYHGDRLVWEAPLDKAHELNKLGDKDSLKKIYNSFHPRPGVTTSVGGAK